MAYNRENKLKQIIDVQNTYNTYKVEGNTTAYVYRTYIKDQFHISINTLYIYLNTRAAHELKLLQEKKQEKKQELVKQAQLFDNDN